jgi:BNR repeat-like domain
VRRAVVAGLIVFGLVSGLARGALTHRHAPLRGTPRADFIVGTPGADVVDARAGNDRVSVAWDDVRDRVDCGVGLDVVNADLLDAVSANCETVARRLSRDTTSDFRAEHETQVEPSALAWGNTVVTAFQSGRIVTGGAAAIGFATSTDTAATWRSGLLPQGSFTTVSDPVVAYDALHARWLVTAIGAAPGVLDLYVVHSRDGLTWSAPLVAASDVDEDYDKEWLTCDNGARSPFRGHCYLAYVDIRTHWLAIRTTTDGGATWSPPARVQPGVVGSTFSGPMPVVRPNGDVLVSYVLFAPIDGEDRIAYVTSRDGGTTWSAPARIAPLSYDESLFELRAPVMPSVVASATGKLYAVWTDDRFRDDGTSMDPVLATSADGVHWSDPLRLPTLAGRNLAFVPAVAVDGTRVAVTYYTAQLQKGCALFHDGCAQRTDAWLVESKDAGATWSRPRQLNAEPMGLDWLAETTLGRMVGDYVGAVYVGGRPLAVIALAAPPTFTQQEAIFAVR